jgi:hypothetical protein
VKTYDLWIAAGYRVKPGEHAVKVKNLRLFHSSQVEKIDAKSKPKSWQRRPCKRQNGRPNPKPNNTNHKPDHHSGSLRG